MTQDPNEVVHNLSTTIVDEDHVIVKESLLMVEKLLKQGPSAKRYHGVLCSSMDMLHALVNATCRSFEILARGSKETHQALEDAVERAQKSTNILRMLAEPQKDRDVPRGEKVKMQMTACCGIVDQKGPAVLSMLLPYQNDRIRNNCLVTIHNIFEGCLYQKQHYDLAKEQIRQAKGAEYMVNLLKNSNNDKLSVILCDCLYQLAKLDKPTKDIIRINQGIECLLHIVQHQQYSNLLKEAFKLLQVLSTDDDLAKEQIRQAKGAEYMINLLKNSNNDQFSVILCDCLYQLAKLDKPTKDVIRVNQGIECLLHIVRHQQYLDLIKDAFRLLQVLSTDAECKQLIHRNFGTDLIAEKLLEFLKQGNAETHRYLYLAASVIRNISDNVQQFKNEDLVMHALIETLRFPSTPPPSNGREKATLNHQVCVLDTLGNILIKMPRFKTKLLNDGMKLFIDILISCGGGNRGAMNLIEPVLLTIK